MLAADYLAAKRLKSLSQPLRVPASHKQHSSWLRGLPQSQ